MDEIKSDYFVSGDQGATYHYTVERADLKDTPGIRRDLVNLFKPEYMAEQTRIDFDKWLALGKQGYCYAHTPGLSEKEGVAMAINFTSKNGIISEVVVGSVSSCQGQKIGKGLGNNHTPVKSTKKAGSGC